MIITYIYYTIYILIVHPQPLIIIYGHFPGGYYGHGAMKSWEERGYISQPLRAARQTLKKRGKILLECSEKVGKIPGFMIEFRWFHVKKHYILLG